MSAGDFEPVEGSGNVFRNLGDPDADLRQAKAVVAARWNSAAPLTVLPGLVPAIHVGPPPRTLPARTAMPQDVDGRNKSGHDGGGDDGGTGAATERRRAPRARRNPSLDPADGPVTRFYQRLAPGPAHLNRTAMEQVRA